MKSSPIRPAVSRARDTSSWVMSVTSGRPVLGSGVVVAWAAQTPA